MEFTLHTKMTLLLKDPTAPAECDLHYITVEGMKFEINKLFSKIRIEETEEASIVRFSAISGGFFFSDEFRRINASIE